MNGLEMKTNDTNLNMNGSEMNGKSRASKSIDHQMNGVGSACDMDNNPGNDCTSSTTDTAISTASTGTTTTSSTATTGDTDVGDVCGKMSQAQRNLLRSCDSIMERTKAPLYKFVFTGGPCGGKTTALARIFSFLRERNFEVITCPEAYTILNSNGMSSAFFSTEGMDKIIQSAVMKCQIAFEDGVSRVLEARGMPAVMLCDRGLLDGSIFLSESTFREVLAEHNTDIVQARDSRYDAIFHLVTAADGAEAYYTLENNKVRWETKEQARANDKLIQKAWVGHPHLYVIDNSTDFEHKMSRLVDIICKIVGLPSNLKRRSARFLLKSPPDLTKFPPDVKYQVFDVEKVYLQQRQRRLPTQQEQQKQTPVINVDDTDSYSFIRRRTNIDPVTGKSLSSVYQLTVATKIVGAKNTDGDMITDISCSGGEDDELIEQKRIISQREYESTSNTGRDPNRYIVKQRRISFLYDKQSFNIHIYQEPVCGVCILHAQVEAEKKYIDTHKIPQHNSSSSLPDVSSTNTTVNTSTNTSSIGTTPSQEQRSQFKIILPPFLDIDRRLTSDDDAMYGAYSLSIRKDITQPTTNGLSDRNPSL